MSLLLSLLSLGPSAFGRGKKVEKGEAERPEAEAATVVDNGWDATLFDYDRPEELAVEETTPTAAQVDWRTRPPEAEDDAPAPQATETPAEPRTVGPLDVVHLRFTDVDGDVVPALLCKPAGQKGPFKLAVAVHGLGSNKAQVCAQVAPELVERGFAVLAPDMPRHGERPGDPFSVLDLSDIGQTFTTFRRAVNDVRQCIDLAEKRDDLDVKDGVLLVGYSMGALIDSIAGPADSRVKAMVLMVGGARGDIPEIALRVPQVAAISPQLAIAHFAGRPLLMLNGKDDPIITPDMGKRLFGAAGEPKEQRWYDCGHLLTADAYEEAAEWAEEKMNGDGEDGKDDDEAAKGEPVAKKKVMKKAKKKAKKKSRKPARR